MTYIEYTGDPKTKTRRPEINKEFINIFFRGGYNDLE